MDLGDLFGQLAIAHRPRSRGGITACVEDSTGASQQLTRPLDAVTALLLRLKERFSASIERVHAHRVSLSKKTVARLRTSTSSRSRRFSRRSAASSSRSLLVSPSRRPASTSA